MLNPLQGRGGVKTALGDQNTRLKMVLQRVTSASNKMAANYRDQRKLNKDPNTQPNQQLQSTRKEGQENKMLHHQMKTMEISSSHSLDKSVSASDEEEEEEQARIPLLAHECAHVNPQDMKYSF